MRGVNKRYKQEELKDYIKSRDIKLAGIIETRVKEHNVARVIHNIVPNWGILTNYQHAVNRRVWLIWDTNWYAVKLLKEDAQIIH